MDVLDAIENSKLLFSDIVSLSGKSYGAVKKESGLTETQLIARDTQINVYDVVGYGPERENMCTRCSIIVLRKGAGIPDGWGRDQSEIGNVCIQCMAEIIDRCPREISVLLEMGCFGCENEASEIFFYQPSWWGMGEVSTWRSIPTCKKCKEILNEKSKSELNAIIRDLHARLGDSVIDIFS